MLKELKIENKDLLKECLIKEIKTNEKEECLVFKDLTRDMFKDNKYILDKYFKNKNKQDCFYANLLSLKDVESYYELSKILKRDFNKKVCLAGYKYDERHYLFSTLAMQLEYEEDLFKDNEENVKESRKEPLDIEGMDRLFKIVNKALQKRLVIILNLENAITLINNAIDCFYKDVSCGLSNALINAKLQELERLLSNKEVEEWIKTGASDMSLITDNVMKNDYIRTYQKLLVQLIDYDKDINREEAYLLIHNEYDLFEDEILEYTPITFEEYIDNLEDNNEDYYLD